MPAGPAGAAPANGDPSRMVDTTAAHLDRTGPVIAAARAGERLETLQVLRALAAAMVVLVHCLANFTMLGFEKPALRLGAGVDVFFVISGFVMVHASQRFFGRADGPRAFLVRRLVRIVPLYWLATSLALLLIGLRSTVGDAVIPDAADILTSYLFIPHDTHGFGPDAPFPIHDLGWTLNYEMFFYAVFAAAVLLPRGAAVATVTVVLAGGVLIAAAVPPDSVVLRSWFRPIVLEFVVGMGIALLYARGLRLPPLAGAALAVAAVLVWAGVDTAPLVGEPAPFLNHGFARALVDGGAAALLVAAATLVVWPPLAPAMRWLRDLGDSSYALYLFHPFAIQAAVIVFARVALPQAAALPLLVAVFVATVAGSHLLHRVVEKPLTEFLQRRLVANR